MLGQALAASLPLINVFSVRLAALSALRKQCLLPQLEVGNKITPE